MKTSQRILVVDDDEAIRKSLKKLLEGAGYSAVLARDGQEAEVMLAGQQFDLLILDLDLPKISGWDVLERVATGTRILPVIILTALANECEPGAAAAADALLEKPPDVPVLLETVERLVGEPLEARLRRRGSAAQPGVAPGYLRWFAPQRWAPWPQPKHPRVL